jgi:hypothetical protein
VAGGSVAGAGSSSLAHDAVNPTIVTIAAPPTTAAIRRPNRPEFMMQSYSVE